MMALCAQQLEKREMGGTGIQERDGGRQGILFWLVQDSECREQHRQRQHLVPESHQQASP